jgi:hypothetical protein
MPMLSLSLSSFEELQAKAEGDKFIRQKLPKTTKEVDR